MKVLIVSLLVVGLVGWLANGIKIEEPDDFSAAERARYTKLADAFKQIDAKLIESVDSVGALANIEAAKRIPKKAFAWFASADERALNEALSLFLELEQTDRSCDMKTYECLAKVRLAVEQTAQSLHRIRAVFNHYRQRHAELCRPLYASNYDKLKAQSDEAKKLEAVLSQPDYEYIVKQVAGNADDLPDSIKLIAQGEIELNDEFYSRVGKAVAGYVVITRPGQKFSPQMRRAFLDSFILKTCKRFNDIFASTLVPARFDAAFEDEQQLQFLTRDKRFTNAIVFQRLCKQMNSERKKALDSLVENTDDIPLDNGYN